MLGDESHVGERWRQVEEMKQPSHAKTPLRPYCWCCIAFLFVCLCGLFLIDLLKWSYKECSASLVTVSEERDGK